MSAHAFFTLLNYSAEVGRNVIDSSVSQGGKKRQEEVMDPKQAKTGKVVALLAQSSRLHSLA